MIDPERDNIFNSCPEYMRDRDALLSIHAGMPDTSDYRHCKCEYHQWFRSICELPELPEVQTDELPVHLL